MESHLAINLPALPLTSLHIESPVNITICNNTFIKFRDGAVEFVGLITNLNAPGQLKMCHFGPIQISPRSFCATQI